MLESNTLESNADRNLEIPARVADARERRFRSLRDRMLWMAMATISIGLACIAAQGEATGHVGHPIVFGGLLGLGIAAALVAVRGDLEGPLR